MDWDGTSYDRLSAPQARWGRAVVERLELRGDETALDAGCGTGRVTEELLARVPRGRVIALDASPSMLSRAQERLGPAVTEGRVSFVRGDLLDLSPALLGDVPPLDAVLSTATFHWVMDHDRLFSNIRSVLREGGQLVAQCGGKGNIDGVIGTVRSLGVERAGTWLYATPEDTAARLAKAGFKVLEVWCHPELVSFPDRTALADFLSTVCLREHLGTIPAPQRRPFAEQVAQAMPSPVIDYVRLNMVARAE
ncbi:MAG TPA: class I SAM-dependent methyltransferase [Acidimicrobiales bacterium]|nr:class I SAM-dependent methyltransferase [Acidimicrobiales bacterium]